MTTGDVLDIGGGLGIDRTTLKGVIHDAGSFGNADPIIGALYRGELVEAERLLAEAPVTRRTRALRADVLRERGRFDEAVMIYRALLDEDASATFTQHLGKVHFAAGDFELARSCFASALVMREREGASDDLLESSRLALRRAIEELALCAPPEEAGE